MKERRKEKLNLHSSIARFLLVFFLYGSLLILVTVSIQKNLAETTMERLITAQEELSLTVLEKNLGEGDWSIREHFLCKGGRPLGDGIPEHADIAPFLQTQDETDSFVYCFIDSSLADASILKACASEEKDLTSLLRVAGSTLSAEGTSIVGTFLDASIADELEKSDVFTGRSYVEGRLFYCYYRVIRDADGSRIGAVVAGRSIEELVSGANTSVLNASLAIGVIILYTFFALFLFIVRWNRSINRMEKYLVEIGSGELPAEPLRISGRDELREMAGVINDMKLSLAEKERLKNELALARTIQAEMLPDDSAAGLLPESLRVSGFMAPAKEVGGDLYDFFITEKGHLGLVIADVSDKGAPAALFMATAKMCIKDNMMLGAEPKEVLDRVNNRLLESNKSGLFVTAWIGDLDPDTGHLKYAMAGHPYPFIKRAAYAEYNFLTSDKNLVLAGFPDFDYRQAETDLGPGDRLFLYTDGLDEARDIRDGFFGKQRIKTYLEEHSGTDIRNTVLGMKKAVDVFAVGREQFDDLTMLMVEYKGGARNE